MANVHENSAFIIANYIGIMHEQPDNMMDRHNNNVTYTMHAAIMNHENPLGKSGTTGNPSVGGTTGNLSVIKGFWKTPEQQNFHVKPPTPPSRESMDVAANCALQSIAAEHELSVSSVPGCRQH